METKTTRTVDQEVQHMKELYPTLKNNLVTRAAIEAALKQRIKTRAKAEKKYWQAVLNEIKKLY
jgi:hypothetical protein